MKFQLALFHSLGNLLQYFSCFALRLAMHDDVVGIAFEAYAWMKFCNPHIKSIVKE
jgi:hypothetical protein